MQTTGQRIEEKQDVLKELDPEREERLSESFVNAVTAIYAIPGVDRGRIDREEQGAEEAYERALDNAIADETRVLLELWDSTDEAYRDSLYPYIKPAAKAAIDRREEGR